MRVLSIGGGPGYELVAFERFFRRHLDGMSTDNEQVSPHRPQRCPPIHLVSMDLMPGWRPFVEAMNMHFAVYDIEKGDLLATADSVFGRAVAAAGGGDRGGGGESSFHGVTYVIISYVMIYVTTPAVISMLHRCLQDGHCRAILVSERGQQTTSVGMMEQQGAQVHRLIDQRSGLDERQSMWLRGGTVLAVPKAPPATIFPNVPFEDRKGKQQKRKRYD